MTTWTKKPPTVNGWYWVRAPGKRPWCCEWTGEYWVATNEDYDMVTFARYYEFWPIPIPAPEEKP